MNETIQSVFDGLLLGDASLASRSMISACLRMEIHVDNVDWVDHIKTIFDSNGIKSTIDFIKPRARFINDRQINSGHHVSIRTPMYRNLFSERNRWYPNGVKIIPKDVDISPISIAQWYMGDGSLVKNKENKIN
jgi:hypothetical protein